MEMGDMSMHSAVGKLVTNALIVVKSMYRAGFAESPKYCSMDTPQEECHFQCENNVDNVSWVKSFIGGHPAWIGDWSEELPDKFYPDIARIMCTTPWSAGEHLE